MAGSGVSGNAWRAGCFGRGRGDDRTLEDPDAWIAVDGQLQDLTESNRRAIGLIKSVARPEFVGRDVGMLLDLEPGMRTTSFVPDWRSGVVQEIIERPGICGCGRRSAGGRSGLADAGRGAAGYGAGPGRRDLALDPGGAGPAGEARPAWPAMIYPIHYVEKILKPLVQGSERAYARLERQLAANGRN